MGEAPAGHSARDESVEQIGFRSIEDRIIPFYIIVQAKVLESSVSFSKERSWGPSAANLSRNPREFHRANYRGFIRNSASSVADSREVERCLMVSRSGRLFRMCAKFRSCECGQESRSIVVVCYERRKVIVNLGFY